MWKEIFEHIKRVAIEDFKTFFEPFVWVWRAILRFIRFLARKLKSWCKN
jgi:hypothetical protein